MTKEEFGLFSKALKTYYPWAKLLPNPEAMSLWYDLLSDVPYPLAEVGLKKWVAMNSNPPSIAEIRKMTAEIVKGEVEDWSEGWRQVQKAISRYGYYRPKEALDSMDELTRKCVDRMGFINLCTSENPEADRANFRMIYQQLAERKKADNQLPQPLKTLIDQMMDEPKKLEGK